MLVPGVTFRNKQDGSSCIVKSMRDDCATFATTDGQEHSWKVDTFLRAYYPDGMPEPALFREMDPIAQKNVVLNALATTPMGAAVGSIADVIRMTNPTSAPDVKPVLDRLVAEGTISQRPPFYFFPNHAPASSRAEKLPVAEPPSSPPVLARKISSPLDPGSRRPHPEQVTLPTSLSPVKEQRPNKPEDVATAAPQPKPIAVAVSTSSPIPRARRSFAALTNEEQAAALLACIEENPGDTANALADEMMRDYKLHHQAVLKTCNLLLSMNKIRFLTSPRGYRYESISAPQTVAGRFFDLNGREQENYVLGYVEKHPGSTCEELLAKARGSGWSVGRGSFFSAMDRIVAKGWAVQREERLFTKNSAPIAKPADAMGKPPPAPPPPSPVSQHGAEDICRTIMSLQDQLKASQAGDKARWEKNDLRLEAIFRMLTDLCKTWGVSTTVATPPLAVPEADHS